MKSATDIKELTMEIYPTGPLYVKEAIELALANVPERRNRDYTSHVLLFNNEGFLSPDKPALTIKPRKGPTVNDDYVYLEYSFPYAQWTLNPENVREAMRYLMKLIPDLGTYISAHQQVSYTVTQKYSRGEASQKIPNLPGKAELKNKFKTSDSRDPPEIIALEMERRPESLVACSGKHYYVPDPHIAFWKERVEIVLPFSDTGKLGTEELQEAFLQATARLRVLYVKEFDISGDWRVEYEEVLDF